MKIFMKNFFAAIPLAIGLVLTMFCVVYSMQVTQGDNAFVAFICGVIGVPLLFASIVSLTRDNNV